MAERGRVLEIKISTVSSGHSFVRQQELGIGDAEGRR